MAKNSIHLAHKKNICIIVLSVLFCLSMFANEIQQGGTGEVVLEISGITGTVSSILVGTAAGTNAQYIESNTSGSFTQNGSTVTIKFNVTLTFDAPIGDMSVYFSVLIITSTSTSNLLYPVTITVTGLNADFSAHPNSGDLPLNVQFSNLSLGSIDTYNWDFGDGNTSTEQNPKHTYVQPGTFTVSLSVSGDGGSDTETKTDYISVTIPPLIADFEASVAFGKAPLEVMFTDRSSGYITEWAWDFGNGATTNSQDVMHIFNDPGEFTVTLIVRDGLQDITDTIQLIINVWKENWTSTIDIDSDIFGITAYDENETIILRKLNNSGERILEARDTQGNQKWEFILPDSESDYPGESGKSIGPDGTIYFNYSGDLYAINPNGTLKWKKTVYGDCEEPPAIDNNGNIYWPTSFDRISSINKDGQLNWTVEIEDALFRKAPAIGKNGTIYFGCLSTNKLYAINPDGTIEWSFQADGKPLNPAIGINGTIHFICTDGYLYAVNPDSTLKWKYLTEHEFDEELLYSYLYFDSPIMVDLDGNIYYREYSGLRALTPYGQEIWFHTNTENGYVGWFHIGKDSLIYGRSRNYLETLRLDGTLKWTLPIFETGTRQFIIDDDVLYVLDDNKRIKSISYPVKGIMNSSWPCFWANYKNNSNADDRPVTIVNLPEEDYTHKSELITAFPNPAESHIYLKIETSVTLGAILSVVSATGQVVLSREIFFNSDELLQINTQSWVKGLYNIVFQTDGMITTKKIIIQ